MPIWVALMFMAAMLLIGLGLGMHIEERRHRG
jgi:uncharacterized protein YneF (UPF0154 family)